MFDDIYLFFMQNFCIIYQPRSRYCEWKFVYFREMVESTCTEEKLQYISLVLGMVLCMGDTLPYPHFSKYSYFPYVQ